MGWVYIFYYIISIYPPKYQKKHLSIVFVNL